MAITHGEFIRIYQSTGEKGMLIKGLTQWDTGGSVKI
jgi:hypothetical protein